MKPSTSVKCCIQCNKVFVRPYSCSYPDFEVRKYCSYKCKSLSQIKKPLIFKCSLCLKTFAVRYKNRRINLLKYCSMSCANKVKIREANIRRGHGAKWKGGRFTTTAGYVRVLERDHPGSNKYGYVFEHRLVMEKHLGRLLDEKEVIHHINSIRNDNRIENLKLFSSNGEHKKHEHNEASKVPQRL